MLLKSGLTYQKSSSKATNNQTIHPMEPNGDPPPTWAPPYTLFVPVPHRRRLSSLLILVTLTITFTAVVIFVTIFFLPPTLSRNSQLPKTNISGKKSSWNGNSINIVLVLFAVLCGVFARRNDENPSSEGAETVPNVYEFENRGRRSLPGADWLESPDPKSYDHRTSDYTNTGGNRLRRNSSSYPDLRQESAWGNDDDQKFRFSDDFEVDSHRTSGYSRRRVRQSHAAEKDVIVAETPVREIPVDRFELKNPVPQAPTPPVSQVPEAPAPPPPPTKRRRSVRRVPKKYNLERGGPEAEFNQKRSPSPPPPLPELKFHPLAERREKTQRKKRGTTKEIAIAIVSLYQSTQKKRKKKTKSRDIFEISVQNPPPQATLVQPSTPSVSPPLPPPPPSIKILQNFLNKSSKSKRVHSVPTTNTSPPPPPPPPPSSIFNTIFQTGTKSKRFQSTSASSQPPPTPPPPPPPIFNSLFKNGNKSRRLKYIEAQSPPPPLPPTLRSRSKPNPASASKPPKPTKPHESVIIAPPSPLIPMPPPPPPFKVPEMKFIVKGDFVRIRSGNSSQCSSPGLEDFDVMSVQSDRGDSIGPSISWPSPDVNLKADTFISRRRNEWRLERMRARFG